MTHRNQQFGEYLEKQCFRIIQNMGYDVVFTQGRMDRHHGTDIMLFTGQDADHIRIDITFNNKEEHLLPDGTPQIPYWPAVCRGWDIGYGLKLGNKRCFYEYPVMCIKIPKNVTNAFYQSTEEGIAALSRCLQGQFKHAVDWYMRAHLPVTK